MADNAAIDTIGDLAALLTDQLRMVHIFSPKRPRGRQDLLCAPDVAEALANVIHEKDDADPRPAQFIPPPAFPLIDIPVIISPDSAPGSWRLVTHDGCEVRNADAADPLGAWVSHEKCTITAEGSLR